MKLSLLNRWILFLIGITIMAFGVAFSIKSDLGTSPISSLPYVLSEWTPFTVGMTTIMLHVVMILLQILILRKDYKPFQLVQLPVGIIFGLVIDFAMFVLAAVNPVSYIARWVSCIIGIVLVAFGVSCAVVSKTTVIAGEGLILALCRATGISFPIMKIMNDIGLVVLAVVTSLLFVAPIVGVREGTLAAMVGVGACAKVFKGTLDKIIRV